MNPMRKALLGGAVLASTIGGGVVGAAFLNGTATAADTSSTTEVTAAPAAGTQQAPPANVDPSKGGHTANGITETVLTGDEAEKVKAAALEAVPGATVLRVETDAEGAKYEAHLKKSDGSQVTVKVDESFKVTSTEDGMR